MSKQKAEPCQKCGDRKATHDILIQDVCPTDRGDEVREFEVPVCDRCDPR